MMSYVKSARDLLIRVQSSAEQSGPAWFQLVKEIKDSYGTYFREIIPIVAYSATTSDERDRLKAEARLNLDHLKMQAENQAKQFEASLAEELQKVSTLRDEIEQIVDKAKQAAQQVGVVQHAIHFKEEADHYAKAAKRWLWVTGLLGLITLVLAAISIILYFGDLPNWNTTQGIQLAISKVIIFSVLFFGLISSSRIYRSHSHNYVINKHRQNALSTFEAFAKSAADDQTKSAVLLQTTQCIFSPQHTGYISQESDSSSYSPIVEIIRGIAGSQGKQWSEPLN
jgi:hypothetical protein